MGTSRKRTQKELIEDFLSLCEQKYYAYALTTFESMNGRSQKIVKKLSAYNTMWEETQQLRDNIDGFHRLADELINGGEEAIKKFMNRDNKDLTTLT